MLDGLGTLKFESAEAKMLRTFYAGCASSSLVKIEIFDASFSSSSSSLAYRHKQGGGKRAKKERWNEAYCQIALSTPAADAFFISLFSFLYYLLSIFNKKFSFAFAFALALVDYPTLREVDVSRTRKRQKNRVEGRKSEKYFTVICLNAHEVDVGL